MLSAFLFFIGGAIAMRILQVFLSVTPNYSIWKHTEYTILQALIDLHLQKMTANQIIELAYGEAGREEEFPKVKTAIEQKYNALINTCIQNMKNKLPYKVEYNTIVEAAQHYIKTKKESGDGNTRRDGD